MRPTVERYQYNLWGVLEIKSHGELNQEELEVIKREWAGQACDGWGECFSQEGIECESDCDLYVYFGHSKFRVQTEQELKGIVKEQASETCRLAQAESVRETFSQGMSME